MTWIWMVSVALGSDIALEQQVARPLVGHPILNLRIGVDGVAQGDQGVHPYVCGEVSPLQRVSVEACGNGSGVLHQSDAPDMAHFRVRATVASRRSGRTEGIVSVGVGFAEVQRSADAPGFRFGAAASTEQVEAAGPEAVVGVKGRYWLNASSYVTADAVVGTAHIAAAPAVMNWSSEVVPFAALTVGVGL